MPNTIKMLLVDDSRVMRSIISRMLGEIDPNIHIAEAANAEEARLLALKESFDWVSVDYHMPGDNGIALIRDLQQMKDGSSRYSLFTANIQDSLRQEASDLGVPCFHKPPTEETLSEMLEYFKNG